MSQQLAFAAAQVQNGLGSDAPKHRQHGSQALLVQSEWTLNSLLLLVTRGRLTLLFFWRSLVGQAFECLAGELSLPL